MNRSALISADGAYRYLLKREWYDPSVHTQMRYVTFIGLNPSTADAEKDDPTIRRCIGFAKDWGYSGLLMLNLFAFRSTDPDAMKRAIDPVGPENNRHLYNLNALSSMVVAAWGVHGSHLGQDLEVKKLLPNLYHLGLTKDGHPRHPLYLKKDTKPELWRWVAENRE